MARGGSRRAARTKVVLVLGCAAMAVATAAAGGAGAASRPAAVTVAGRVVTARPLTPKAVRVGTKDGADDMSRVDPSLRGLRGSDLVPVLIRLRYTPVASYRGTVKGLRATSPRVTGRAINPRSKVVRAYRRFIVRRELRFRRALAASVPGARVGRPLRYVYGGIALRVPANRIPIIGRLPFVRRVQRDTVQHVQTDAVGGFIGAPAVTDDIGGSPDHAGDDTILADIDTGIWPEHPSFEDHHDLAPARPALLPRACDFGDDPLTPADDPFVCDNKVLGGRSFLTTYHQVFGDESFPGTARDEDGHGTHTASTAAGGPVRHAPIFGIDRGPVAGIAPGAHILAYRACGPRGCFDSDLVGAVEQAVLDGANVINFSVSGGDLSTPDPVELAFLDAYAAGVLVAASAGNSGPAAGTTDHRWPWVMTVAASTQLRQFQTTLTVAGGGDRIDLVGSSLTRGLPSAAPIVHAGDVAGYDGGDLCLTPAAAGTFTGLVVICTRGTNGRVEKGFNVKQGGAVAMVLANVAPGPTMSDNHFLPAVHLEAPQAAQLDAFLLAHPGAVASFPDGVKGVGQGDRMTDFSSRGPGGLYLKPDIAAPGIQILAGNTPASTDLATGPTGELFQALAGTSMAAPVDAGAALLLKSLHPGWSPGQIASALTTTATTKVVKPDGVTPADAFDLGAGRLDLTQAGHPGLTISESAPRFAAHAADPLAAVDLNIPSVNAPVMPGLLTTRRVVRNVSGRRLRYRTSGASGPGWSVTVRPRELDLRPAQSAELTITIDGREAAVGAQVLTAFTLRQSTTSKVARALHVPVAFVRTQGDVTVAVRCAPATIPKRGTGACDVTIANTSSRSADVTARTRLSDELRVVSAAGAQVAGRQVVTASATLAGSAPTAPAVAPGTSPFGFVDLALLGVPPTPVGDEDVVDVPTGPFLYGGRPWSSLSISSNGWLAVGGTTATAEPVPQVLPDPALPNNVLAPFWTDLDGTGSPGFYEAVVTQGTRNWIVVQWDEHAFGLDPADPATQAIQAQVWIGLNGREDVSFAYDPLNLPARVAGADLFVGAENDDGTAGGGLGLNVAPREDLVITTAPGTPGGTLTYRVRFTGHDRGDATVTTLMATPAVRGTTADVHHITVTRP